MPESLYLAGFLPYAILLLALLVAVVHLASSVNYSEGRAWGGWVLTLGLTLLIGLRPLSPIYVDMMTYAVVFEQAKLGIRSVSFSDPLFTFFTSISAAQVSLSTYFLLCAALYVIPKAFAARLLCGRRWPLALAAMSTSFSFYGFGTNGIRNGIAASFGLLAIASPKIRWKALAGGAAILTHASLILSMLAHAITWRFRSVKVWMWVWIASIPLSLIIPKSAVLSIVSLREDARGSYFDTLGGDSGFRLDFILYSSVGVAAIYYWKYFKRTVDDQFDHVACTYLLANAFWVVINQIAFSNRFAYLSWFLLEITILMPLLKAQLRAPAMPVVILVIVSNAVLYFAIS